METDGRREEEAGRGDEGGSDVGLKLSESTPSSEKEKEREEPTPGDQLVTSVYPCIEQLFHKLTIKKPHLGTYHTGMSVKGSHL